MNLKTLHKPGLLLVAGFGDGPAMFESLNGTMLAKKYQLIPISLPGFCGEPALPQTNLTTLAAYVAEIAYKKGARMAVGHSIASVVVSLAALNSPWQIDTILSLEGNLTEKDGYFTATALDFDCPKEFKRVFLRRLDKMAREDPILKRYIDCVAKADPNALWQLGCDAARFSKKIVPGKILQTVPKCCYFYNPANCHQDSLGWLEQSRLDRTVLHDASHWPTVDMPNQVSDAILNIL